MDEKAKDLVGEAKGLDSDVLENRDSDVCHRLLTVLGSTSAPFPIALVFGWFDSSKFICGDFL